MRSRFRTTLLVAFAVLTAALAALWVRSFWVEDTYHVFDPPAGLEWTFYSARGRTSFYRVTWDPHEKGNMGVSTRGYSRIANPRGLEARDAVLLREPDIEHVGPFFGLGFFLQRHQPGWSTFFHWEVTIPYWFATSVTAAATVWLVRSHLRDRRARTVGLCPKCGYDLRATPGRCPECGATPPPPLDRPPPPASDQPPCLS